jgi:hypothetical protein
MRSFVARADPNFEGFSRLHGADSAAGQYAPMDPIMALLRLNVRFGGAHLGRTQYLPISCTDCYVTTLRIDAWLAPAAAAAGDPHSRSLRRPKPVYSGLILWRCWPQPSMELPSCKRAACGGENSVRFRLRLPSGHGLSQFPSS